MLTIIFSFSLILTGLSLCMAYHFINVSQEIQWQECCRPALTATQRLLADLENPIHQELAEKNPQYARDFLLFAFDTLQKELATLLQADSRMRIHCLFQFSLFKLYLQVFRLKTHWRANLADLRYLAGYEHYILSRIN